MKRAIGYNKRLANLEEEIKSRNLDSFLVTNEINVSYLSGFFGHDSMLLVTPKKKFFITDSRYIEEAKNDIKGFDLQLVRRSNYDTLKNLIKKNHLKRVGIESMNLPYEVAGRLKRLISYAHLVPIRDLVETLRAIKDDAEIELIKKSISLAKDVFGKIRNFVKPGAQEKFLSRKIELEFIKNGARAAFEPIVAQGANSSKPHAKPTDDRIRKNSFVMMDFGCNLKGYNSDLTRMLALGRVKAKFKEIFNIVLTAQRAAIDKIRPGIRIREIDLAARRYIENRSLGRYFGHSLGHGVGMEVHEEPTISTMNESILKTGMVFTVEPAVYIPGFGGVRIEDMVLVTKTGCEILTQDND